MLVLGRARLVMVEGSDAIAKGMGAVVIFHTLLQSIMNTAMSMQLLKKLDKYTERIHWFEHNFIYPEIT